MRHKEIITVCSGSHTENINALWTERIIFMSKLMVYRVAIGFKETPIESQPKAFRKVAFGSRIFIYSLGNITVFARLMASMLFYASRERK